MSGNTNNVNTNVNNNNDYSAQKFFYNNSLFIAQATFSLFATVFSAYMLIIGKPAEVYLPVITSCVSLWLPSPINHKVDPPTNLQQFGLPQFRLEV